MGYPNHPADLTGNVITAPTKPTHVKTSSWSKLNPNSVAFVPQSKRDMFLNQGGSFGAGVGGSVGFIGAGGHIPYPVPYSQS